MKTTKTISKDDVPQTSASGYGAQEQRECGPIDPNFDAEKHTNERLAKQRDPVSLGRTGQTPNETGVAEPPYNERVQECSPLDRTYKSRR